jgi:hypothetical protein
MVIPSIAQASHIPWNDPLKTEYSDIYFNAGKDKYLKADFYFSSSRWNGFILKGSIDQSFTIYGYDPYGNTILKHSGTLTSSEIYIDFQDLGLDDPPQIRLTGNSGVHIKHGFKNDTSLVIFKDSAGNYYDETHGSNYDIPYDLNYLDYRDEYRLDYWNVPQETTSYTLKFTSDTGTYYETNYNMVPTGIHYLTCNGTYEMAFKDSSGSQTGTTGQFVTNQLVNPSCNSYPEQSGTDDLNLQATDNGDGTFTLEWDNYTGAAIYEIYKDGQKIGETTQPTKIITGDGAVSVIAKDSTGTIIAQSDIRIQVVQSSSETDEVAYVNTEILEVLESLRPIFEKIERNTGDTVTKLVLVLNELTEIKVLVEEFKNEFQTDIVYEAPTLNQTDYPTVTLDTYKPPMREEGVFTDNTIYFEDQGDALSPPPFPTAPEPVETWKVDDLNSVSKQLPLTKEPINTRDPTPTRDLPQTKEPSLTRDLPQTREPVRTKDLPLQQDKTTYPLRWKSSEYGN